MTQRSSLTEEADLDALVLHVQQQPVAAYVLPGFVMVFVVMGLGGLIPAIAPFVALFFVLFFGSLLTMGFIRPKLRIEISPTTIEISGWVGKLPMPRTVELPTAGTTLSHTYGAQVNGVQMFVVTLTHADQVVVLPSVRCTEQELRGIQERIQGMQALAELKLGEGEEEVPEELDELVRAHRPQDEQLH